MRRANHLGFNDGFICLDLCRTGGAVSERIAAESWPSVERADKSGGAMAAKRKKWGLLTVALLCAPLLLTACASTSYMGVPLTAGAADAELQSLARRAQAGDKQAQLELGIRYEEGIGVPVDLRRAERLYRAAASDSGGTQMVYIPASREGGRAASVPINSGPAVQGLPAARARLFALTRRTLERSK